MFERLSLNGTWELYEAPLDHELSNANQLTNEPDGWIPTPVPGDIHQGLLAAGKIPEPLLGLNSFDCHWTEERSWWFRKQFEVPPAWIETDVIELSLYGLDSNAEVFLNGQHIGSHRSAFYPLVLDVKPCLEVGKNVLLIRLTAGLETVPQEDVDALWQDLVPNTEARRDRPERGDARRPFVRKPQYSFGWDWSPRVPTTAIAGGVEIVAMDKACIRHVSLRPMRHGKEVLVFATLTVDQFHFYKTAQGTVSMTLTDEQGRSFNASQSVLLRSGDTFCELTIPIADAQLWWPNGMGKQHLYRVEAQLEVGGECSSYPAFAYGIRFLELSTENDFAIVINGKKCFSKGANWIPADAVYARVDDARYEKLIREARDANFNMLRIWGGGWYEREAFYQACDRYGIMIWHDFMFACSPYPDHDEIFRFNVACEADYQTKRLQQHACIALWCGSNENNWGFRDWWDEQTQGGAYLYNYMLPNTVQCNVPEIPYWNGSPYGGEEPNSSKVGDRHHWHDCMMNEDMNKRITPEEYDKCTSLFVSEFGYVGACGQETVLTYLDGASFDRKGQVWQHHNNTFEQDTVDAGIAKHYIDPDTLTPDAYLLYSGLCQGLMYSYALESMRYRANCHGSLFWMYNDCWGEVGWTIVDYYLRRKPSWYFVRRAYAPLRLILRSDGETVRIVLANDSLQPTSFELEYGYVSLDGTVSDLQSVTVNAPALTRTELYAFERGTNDPVRGLWIARAREHPDIAPAILRAADYRQLQTVDPGLKLTIVSVQDLQCTIQVSATGYAHAVQILLPNGALPSDNYFDLLPGETREVTVTSTQAFDAEQVSVTCVNASRQ